MSGSHEERERGGPQAGPVHNKGTLRGDLRGIDQDTEASGADFFHESIDFVGTGGAELIDFQIGLRGESV